MCVALLAGASLSVRSRVNAIVTADLIAHRRGLSLIGACNLFRGKVKGLDFADGLTELPKVYSRYPWTLP